MISKTDLEVIDFLKNYRCATTSTLAEAFYGSRRYAQHRLKQLHDDYKEVKRERENINKEYYYWIPGFKPKQMKHSLILTKFYAEVYKHGLDIKVFRKAFKSHDIMPDGFIAYEYKGKTYLNFIEIQLSPRPDIEKYNKYLHLGKWKEKYPVFPRVILISNRRISLEQKIDYKLIQIREDLSDADKLLHNI